jgi:hypothetical protein
LLISTACAWIIAAALQFSTPDAKAQLTVTSEPSGAEIEIGSEFIGSTPTTADVKAGRLNIIVKKNGFHDWQRSLRLNPGDQTDCSRRHGEMSKENEREKGSTQAFAT